MTPEEELNDWSVRQTQLSIKKYTIPYLKQPLLKDTLMQTKTSHSWKAIQPKDIFIGYETLPNITQGDNKNGYEKRQKLISSMYDEIRNDERRQHLIIIGTVIGGLALFFIYLYFFTGLAIILK